MRLPNDVSRCIALVEPDEPDLDKALCPLRNSCARYLQRATGGEWTPMIMTCHDGSEEPFSLYLHAVEEG